jgi:hypothetical protein
VAGVPADPRSGTPRAKGTKGRKVYSATPAGAIQVDQQPLPDFVEALFDHSLGQLRAEAEWVSRILAYMASKPWLL